MIPSLLKNFLIYLCLGLSITPSFSLNSSNSLEKPPMRDAPSKPKIFVSLNMPDLSLKTLAQEAKKQGAVLVMRGFVQGSLKATLARLQQLNISVQIDPKAFEQYQINRVPAFLIPNPAHPEDPFLLFGHVSLEFALAEAKKTGDTHG